MMSLVIVLRVAYNLFLSWFWFLLYIIHVPVGHKLLKSTPLSPILIIKIEQDFEFRGGKALLDMVWGLILSKN